ncbi:kinase-like domain-containing protein [Hypoxylon trugodes]|uniref:kinase-like domain-containing protein n=1 Tax=Hypoxylon trugodes TaxID=326681 RepID=UPI002198B7AB|nr:kinase-like domain-containing protein [Hypoxylon trugodes]KAI1388927.1 kinase-like domain-containing protein [Hypoxylon trugodes]
MLTEDEFLYEIHKGKNFENDHLVSYFGSYAHQGFVYVLFTHPSDYSLKSLLVNMPSSLKSLAKQDRRRLLMNWIHCLVDSLCYLHSHGLSHGNIKPSTILFNSENQIFYTDISRLSIDAISNNSDRPTFDKESYDYAAPEQWYRPSPTHSHSGLHRKSTLIASSVSASTSSDNSSFSINRGTSESSTSPSSLLHSPTPSLNPLAVDIFSLGCIILELMSLLLKRQTRNFASHRAAKHKQAGRGGAVLDSSFHKNIGQVESWMTGLAKEAAAKNKKHRGEDPIFRGVAPTLQLVARMMSVVPQERPTAREVEQRVYRILTEECGIAEPHCVHQYEGFDFGLGGLHISRGDGFNIATTPRRYSGSVRPGSSSKLAAYRPLSSSSIQERDMAGASGSATGSSSQAQRNAGMNRVRTWQAHMYAADGGGNLSRTSSM